MSQSRATLYSLGRDAHGRLISLRVSETGYRLMRTSRAPLDPPVDLPLTREMIRTMAEIVK